MAVLAVASALVMACGPAGTGPLPSLPPVPVPPPGWISLGSAGSGGGSDLAGFSVESAGRPLALHVACVGAGTLVVTFGYASVGEPLPVAGQDAVAFPCSTSPDTTMRHELPADVGPGALTIAGGVVPAAGDRASSAFTISLEEAVFLMLPWCAVPDARRVA